MNKTEEKIPLISGLRQIAPSYKGFILDLWGTVHNGVAPYDGVLACLRALKEEGKKVIFLSNAPRRSAIVEKQLSHFGISPNDYDGIVTSGEVAYQLMAGQLKGLPPLGRHMLLIGGLHDLDLYQGLDLEPVSEVEKADFVLNTGPDGRRGTASIDPYIPQLDECLRRQLPMICPNPDRIVMKGAQRQICAGALAQYYQEHGGKVIEVGKPFSLVYDMTLKLLGTPVGQTLAIGDSLATDIKGAQEAGIDSLWLLAGIHQDLLENGERELLAICRKAGVRPRAVMQSLKW